MKTLRLAITLITLLPLFACRQQAGRFDEKSIALSLGVISDTHIGNGYGSEDKLRSVLAQLKEHLGALCRFNGCQPDHKRREIPIRHWDGYWFGRNRRYGDTLHQHSAFSARAFILYAAATGEKGWRERAERCLRNCLCMFRPDGTATAAWMLPFSTVMLDDRGEPLFPRQLGEGPDPFVNDMDLALYIAMASGLFGDFGGEKADATFPRVR